MTTDAEAMGLEPDDTRVRCWYCKRRQWNADVKHAICTLGRFRMWDPVVPRMCDDFVIKPPRERVALP